MAIYMCLLIRLLRIRYNTTSRYYYILLFYIIFINFDMYTRTVYLYVNQYILIQIWQKHL